MLAAYTLSLLFTLPYGYLAARNRRAEHVLLPLLDVLQSVPILSFLPVVLLSLTAILPERLAVELAAIVLIFTSQAWNLTFAWYQALTTIPKELREANAAFRFPPWLRLTNLELPFAALSLVWNSVMSWAGGWFFLMAAEIFSVGHRDFRLPGLGAYLQAAANQGDPKAILWGVGVLVLIIVLLDQFVWRPLLAWADRFKLEMVEGEGAPSSWFLNALREARVVTWGRDRVWSPVRGRAEAWLLNRMPSPTHLGEATPPVARWGLAAVGSLFLAGALLVFLASVTPAYGESPLVADLAAFFNRYHENPPHLDALRSGLKRAVETDPDLPNLVALAKACFLWGDVRATTLGQKLAAYDEGREAGRRAVELAPSDPLAHLWYAIDTARWGEAKGVVRSLFLLPTVKREIATIMGLDPTLAPAYALAGNVYYEVPSLLGGDLETAERMFRKGLELAPHFTGMHVGLAKTLVKEGRIAEARQELQRVLTEAAPENLADWTLKDNPEARRLLDSLG
jgi:ABC-type nitrate/sulfonate/bicarbonate transport system permease component